MARRPTAPSTVGGPPTLDDDRGVVGPSLTFDTPFEDGAVIPPGDLVDETHPRGLREGAEDRRRPHMFGTNGGSPFLTDVRELRERARRHIEQGAVTEGYKADRDKVIQLLNEALATELICALRYKRHYHAASGVSGEKAKEEFLEHALQEEQHADRLATRITELGGLPDYSPDTLSSRAHSEYVEGVTLADMLKEDLIAERIAIDSYSEMIRFLGDSDITSRRILEEILAVEEEHANDLTSLLQDLGHD